MYFWYRQNPEKPEQPLAQRLAPNDTSGWSMPGRVLPNEPPLREPGMICVFLDLEGRLLELHAVPPREPPAESHEPNPQALLDAAGFTEGSLRESKDFRHVPPVSPTGRRRGKAPPRGIGGAGSRRGCVLSR